MYPSTLFESCHICNTTHRSRRCAGGAQLLDATVPPTVVVDAGTQLLDATVPPTVVVDVVVVVVGGEVPVVVMLQCVPEAGVVVEVVDAEPEPLRLGTHAGGWK